MITSVTLKSGYLLVKPDDENKTPRYGTVVAVGPDYSRSGLDASGNVVRWTDPINQSVGDRVEFTVSLFGANKVIIQGEVHYVTPSTSVGFILNEDES